ncbi:hypothetical protein NEISICOT_02634 [Neisseria sicca ATCC 29256]|uniref:Uncharacterized protein n=1 Tax=Neisseria sicca ATCC 29256 TaxID=547045 RepID=C6M7W9_NEISI|nr:hypothetical protein NEISICOT_02634 [Neisseria sicca ATCC 29256]
MLKRGLRSQSHQPLRQPPSGGCVLKHKDDLAAQNTLQYQPPSGGCVLKHNPTPILTASLAPAAFGRLCVETIPSDSMKREPFQPPSGGCVLKQTGNNRNIQTNSDPSRLRAAVC